MKVTMMLCDSAQVADGKLYILGGGWSVTGPDPAPSAIAIKLEVDWHEAATGHHWELFLVDADGREISFETPEGTRQAIEIRGDFEVGRPQGVPPGTPIDLPLAINLGPLPLSPGGRYTWRFTVDGDSDTAWAVSFTTRPAVAV
ncbi:MAG: hypothetical protein ABIW46_02250 [Acidimicrobiales bacterium]